MLGLKHIAKIIIRPSLLFHYEGFTFTACNIIIIVATNMNNISELSER